ncbi:MAG: replication initiation protein [Bacteroidaceae bacterium]|nr:replication initiation protein [Bacteroidaceae bacterium]
MARKSRKAEQLKAEIISSVPVEQRKLITQPVTFTYLNGEMSMMQTRIQTSIMEKLQEKIQKALDRQLRSGFAGDLFDVDDFHTIEQGDKTQYLTFTIAYSELGVEPSHYNDVDVAAKNMQNIVYEKEVGGVMRYTVAFPVVDLDKDIPGKRRQNIYLHMTQNTAKDLFKMIPYHKYLKDAIFLFSSNYAGRIYLLINANKTLGTWRIEYEKLRKILLTSYDRETKKTTVDKYKDFSDFKKRVLEPARKEIDEAKDRIDCTFDYELEYPAGKKRGTPLAILFHIHITDLGRNMKQSMLESRESIDTRNALCAIGLSVVDASRLMRECPMGVMHLLRDKAEELKKLFADMKNGKHPDKQIENPRAYAIAALKNLVTELNERATDAEQEVSTATEVQEAGQDECPTLSAEDQARWERVKLAATEAAKTNADKDIISSFLNQGIKSIEIDGKTIMLTTESKGFVSTFETCYKELFVAALRKEDFIEYRFKSIY